eukprot:4508754-Lingulodinium_polyedra.AAC.1
MVVPCAQIVSLTRRIQIGGAIDGMGGARFRRCGRPSQCCARSFPILSAVGLDVHGRLKMLEC